MSANRQIKILAQGTKMFRGTHYSTCSCHPRQWGLKKGLRRARRRFDREAVVINLHENEPGTAEKVDLRS